MTVMSEGFVAETPPHTPERQHCDQIRALAEVMASMPECQVHGAMDEPSTASESLRLLHLVVSPVGEHKATYCDPVMYQRSVSITRQE